MADMTTVSARDASRGFAALLDRVEHDAEEYTIVRDGKVVARIVPATEHTAASFLARRCTSPSIDADFVADVLGLEHLVTTDTEAPWRD